MDTETFKKSLAQDRPPADASLALQALWQEGTGDWKGAHERLQDDASAEGAWVHAYLHRKEGDLANAAYWYRRAGQPIASGAFEAEWEEIARALIGPSRT